MLEESDAKAHRKRSENAKRDGKTSESPAIAAYDECQYSKSNDRGRSESHNVSGGQ